MSHSCSAVARKTYRSFRSRVDVRVGRYNMLPRDWMCLQRPLLSTFHSISEPVVAWLRRLHRVEIFRHQLLFSASGGLITKVRLIPHFLPMFVDSVHLFSVKNRTRTKWLGRSVGAEIYSAHELQFQIACQGIREEHGLWRQIKLNVCCARDISIAESSKRGVCPCSAQSLATIVRGPRATGG
jgi:hypothetical protein